LPLSDCLGCELAVQIHHMGFQIPKLISLGPDPKCIRRISLADARMTMFDLSLLKLLSASAEFRDKSLKGCQYSAKLAAIVVHRTSRPDAGPSHAVPTLKAAAKTLSSARRFIVILRWIKYIDELRAAHTEPDRTLRRLTLVDVTLNILVDAMQDVVTLEKLGVLGHGVLPVWFEPLADKLDVCLAANSVVLTGFKLARGVRMLRVLESKETEEGARAKAHRMIAAEQLALLKYACDLLKTLDSAGRTPGEGLAATAAVISSVLSARKIVVKAR
jgi:hypothetical protein